MLGYTEKEISAREVHALMLIQNHIARLEGGDVR